MDQALVAQAVKSLPAVQKTWVWSLGWEDPRRREWQHTPVLLPGEFHGQRSLAYYSSWGCKELHMTKWLTQVYSGPGTVPDTRMEWQPSQTLSLSSPGLQSSRKDRHWMNKHTKRYTNTSCFQYYKYNRAWKAFNWNQPETTFKWRPEMGKEFSHLRKWADHFPPDLRKC